jgi:transposase
MDNASIHKAPEIMEMVEERGYRCVYLPPYSPFLNPIEEFWSKLKAGVKWDGLSATDNLSVKINESAKKITERDCQGWIRHSVDRCLAREINLNCNYFIQYF